MYFPPNQFGILYSISLIPIAIAQFFVPLLFKLIDSGDSISEANFAPVSTAFGVCCLICSFLVIYNFKLTKKLFEETVNNNHNPNFQPAPINSWITYILNKRCEKKFKMQASIWLLSVRDFN